MTRSMEIAWGPIAGLAVPTDGAEWVTPALGPGDLTASPLSSARHRSESRQGDRRLGGDMPDRGDTRRRRGAFLRNADVAMNRAKAAGRGCYEVLRPEMHHHALNRLNLEAGLRRAVERSRRTRAARLPHRGARRRHLVGSPPAEHA